MRAISISGGKGTRLYPQTKNTPRNLLDVGERLTLLEAQLHSLQKAGIVDVTIIVGYGAEQVEAKLHKYKKDFNVNIVYNPFYDISNGLVKEVSKQINVDNANGESVGINKFSDHGPKIYLNTLDEMVRHPENRNVFYLKAIQEIINKGYPVHFSKCKPGDWGELDFHPDLMMIRKYVTQTNLVEKIINK